MCVIRPINQRGQATQLLDLQGNPSLQTPHTLIGIGQIEVSIARIAVTRFVITVLCDSLGNYATGRTELNLDPDTN